MAAPQRKSFSCITWVRSEPAGILLVMPSAEGGDDNNDDDDDDDDDDDLGFRVQQLGRSGRQGTVR